MHQRARARVERCGVGDEHDRLMFPGSARVGRECPPGGSHEQHQEDPTDPPASPAHDRRHDAARHQRDQPVRLYPMRAQLLHPSQAGAWRADRRRGRLRRTDQLPLPCPASRDTGRACPCPAEKRSRNQANRKAMQGTRFCLHAKASNSRLRTAPARPWKVWWMAGN